MAKTEKFLPPRFCKVESLTDFELILAAPKNREAEEETEAAAAARGRRPRTPELRERRKGLL